MGTRSAELRRRSRRIFAFSLAAAAAVHVLVFIASPEFRAEMPWSRTHHPSDSTVVPPPAQTIQLVNVFFGPPEIVAEDGSIWKEPPERTLEARGVNAGTLTFSAECRRHPRNDLVPAEARVRIRLGSDGRVLRESIAETSGHPCRDEMVEAIARSVWYRWVPNERFGAPVELVQPMRVVSAEN